MTAIEKDRASIRVCIAGIAGRMGTMVAREISTPFVIGAAVESSESPKLGMALREAGIAESDATVSAPEDLEGVLRGCDVFISFATVGAELTNLPIVARLEKPAVVGTTGFSNEQRASLNSIVRHIPIVISPNFSVGANFLFAMTKTLSGLPAGYDFSILEIHHNRKADAPSGTAAKLAEIVTSRRGYTELVHGRNGISGRKPSEMEVLSIRGGGNPGEHEVLAAGAFENIRLEHSVFSRSAFAQGALVAAKWVLQQKPGIYGMDEVLGLS